eukprot:scaffold34524_cov73-Cyclotella_meneghiniana.AAC.2
MPRGWATILPMGSIPALFYLEKERNLTKVDQQLGGSSASSGVKTGYDGSGDTAMSTLPFTDHTERTLGT